MGSTRCASPRRRPCATWSGIAGKPHTRSIVACLGPKTAETAREFGLRVDVQPEVAEIGALVEALAEHATRLRADGALPPPRKSPRRR